MDVTLACYVIIITTTFLLCSSPISLVTGLLSPSYIHQSTEGGYIISLHYLLQGEDVTLVERRIMLSHVLNALNLFLTMKRDISNMSETGVYIVAERLIACLH